VLHLQRPTRLRRCEGGPSAMQQVRAARTIRFGIIIG
jgi:hypothetical protein